MLEGCGSIAKGQLRVIGQTPPVPFVTVFVTDALPADAVTKLREALLAARQDPDLLRALESREGFVPWTDPDWPDWRGPGRRGQATLPMKLPEHPTVLWRQPASDKALAGLAVAEGRVIVAGRDTTGRNDVFRCLRAADGCSLWTLEYAAEGRLDYGEEPRATPVINDGRVYLLGAMGHLHCVSLTDGTILWQCELIGDLGGQLPVWGYCSSPLIVDDLLIVNPGGKRASIVALDSRTGRRVWAAPGAAAAYASFISAELGGYRQLVGYDAESLGGWDIRTGRRLWKLVPPQQGDFNVPTPLVLDTGLLVATEHNGTRLYRFKAGGLIDPEPVARNKELSPPTCTPVVCAGRLLGAGPDGLHCLDVNAGLNSVWTLPEEGVATHACLIADADRVFVVTHSGECVLLDVTRPEARVLSRSRIASADTGIYAHPALSCGRLFVRDTHSVFCIAVSPVEPAETRNAVAAPRRVPF